MGTEQRNNLKALRAGYSQKEIADMIGVGEATYQRWELGTAIPYPQNQRRLCQIFETNVEGLGLEDGTLSCIIESNDTSSHTDKIQDFIDMDLSSSLLSLANYSTYTDQTRRFSLVIEKFDAMSCNEYTRREAIMRLATLPFVSSLLGKTNRVSSSHLELFLKQCGASLVACQELASSTEASDFSLAFQCVSRYLLELRTIINSSSRYRIQALELAAHCALLKTNLGWPCSGDAETIVFAQNAVQICHEYGDVSLLLSAHSKLSWAYLYDGKRYLALETSRTARDILEKASRKPLSTCVRGGTYSTLSVMQASNYQSPDTALKKAIEQDPGEEIVDFMAFTREHAVLEEAQAWFYAGEDQKALKAYSTIVDTTTLALRGPFKKTLSERERIDTILGMTRALLKVDERDMQQAIKYWKATLEGARNLRNESMFNGAITTYDQLEIAFGKKVRDLRDLIKHW